MEFLITLIGNAVVDPIFREHFLADPVHTLDEFDFRLTKGEFEMMKTVFAGLTEPEKTALNDLFLSLENALYNNLSTRTQKAEPAIAVCGRPCRWSIFPPGEPHELRKEWENRIEKGMEPKTGKKAA